MPANRNGGASGAEPLDGETGELDVHDPAPPSWAVMAAEDVVRRVLEPDNTGMLRWLRRSAAPPVLRVEDKYLVGTLDLRALEFPYLLEFVRCRFEHRPDVRQANLAGLEFNGCWLPGLKARNARSDNDIALVNTTVRGGAVDLTDAHIRGSLVLSHSRLNNPGGRGLHADRLELAGALLAYNLEVVGEVRIPGLRSGGNVNFSGAGLHNMEGCALDGNGMQVGGNLVCAVSKVTGQRFRSTGWVFLPSVQVESDFSMRGAQLRPGGGSRASLPVDDPYYDEHTTLIADRMKVGGNVDLDQDFASTGTLRIVNAQFGGSLRMTGANVDISGGHEAPFDRKAVYLDGTHIDGNLDAPGVRVTGEWRLLDLGVRGNVRLDGSVLANPGNDVWVGRRSTVGGNFECRDADIYGSMIMQEVQIGANLDLRASHLSRPGRYTRDRNLKPSLDIRAGRIGRDVVCAAGTRRSFSAAGEVRMVRATIGRQLTFSGAELGELDSKNRSALNAFGAQTQELNLTLARPPQGRVGLRQLRCTSLDDNEALWQASGGIDMDLFRYDSLTKAIDLADDAAVVRRLRWLRNAEIGGYSPGPYDQLAGMLRANGNEEHADTVLIEKQRRRYAALASGFRVLGTPVVIWSWLQRWMVGYGYRPSRALGWLALLLVAGTLWFALYPTHCVPVPGDPSSFTGYRFCPLTNQDDHLVWNPFLFTLDLLVPIVDFGNKNRWALPGASQWFAAALTAGGWLLATTVAAGVTRMVRRQ
ncbi:MAG TPA: oxidoreductase [Pseudonocardiaceae bacterium]|jgi:hypothetical protein|nr:oxidoreductase [Pseudonocardiaceae bacterium]